MCWSWIALSICISFILLFCFANFVNWPSLLDWMRFEAVDIQVSRNSFFFRNFVEFQTLTWTATFGFIGVVSEQCSKDIVFPFISCLKKQISLLGEEIWLRILQRISSRYLSFSLIRKLLFYFPLNDLLQLHFGCFVIVFIDVSFSSVEMVDLLLIEGVSFMGVVRRLKFIGISLSVRCNKISLIDLFFSPIAPAKCVCIDNCFAVAIQINKGFTTAVNDCEYAVQVSDTEILFQ